MILIRKPEVGYSRPVVGSLMVMLGEPARVVEHEGKKRGASLIAALV